MRIYLRSNVAVNWLRQGRKRSSPERTGIAISARRVFVSIIGQINPKGRCSMEIRMPSAREVAQAIRDLCRETRYRNINWRDVSRKVYGDREFAEILQSWAELEENRGYFHCIGNRVSLTEAGAHLADQPIHIDNYRQLIGRAVRHYAGQLQPLNLTIEAIRGVARSQHRYVQAVSISPFDELLPADTPVNFCPHDRGVPTYGRIVGHEIDSSILYVAFEAPNMHFALPASLKVDRAYLLHQLASRVESAEDLERGVEALFRRIPGAAEQSAAQDAQEVVLAIAQLRPPWLRFLWGPPGGGKTWGIAHLVAHLLRNEPDSRMLLVAASNRAVDVAMWQLMLRLEAEDMWAWVTQRRILRFGYPRLPYVIQQETVLGPPDLDDLSNGAANLAREISEKERAAVRESELSILRAELLSYQEEIKEKVSDHVAQCRVVATTATLTTLDRSPIKESKWDLVIVDEATMVTPAMGTYLASLAPRILFAGDPRQLGPVYAGPGGGTDTWRWMGQDMFQASDLCQGLEAMVEDDLRLYRITSQRRCDSHIWKHVSNLYPDVELIVDRNATIDLAALPPQSGEAVVVMDISNRPEGLVCEHVSDSWRNLYSAALAIEVASTVAAEADRYVSIAIISPYRAQIQYLRKWMRSEKQSSELFASTDIGTVHQFQGSDADIVILDLVDGNGRNSVGALLRDVNGVRLVNVAVTRAKGKLIVLADLNWYRTHLREEQNPLLYGLLLGNGAAPGIAVLPPPSQDNPTPLETESPIEELFLKALASFPDVLKQVKTQYSIFDEHGRFISRADFAFPNIKFAVYCDGARWHLKQSRWQRDVRQRNELIRCGWIFYVF
ncbi:MAG: hypothetical protein FJW35_05265, partial [Acidobacteria bacterium]|nr:hypothetical protein [Acidobacteriota bacterium]